MTRKITNIRIITRLIGIMVIAFLLSSCHEIVLRVEDVPENTPEGSSIYVAGNFNFWNPGDEDFMMHQLDDGSYIITLPKLFGKVEYKFTRGDWSTVEKSKCGSEIENWTVISGDTDTMIHKVACWGDVEPINCDSITIVITDLPKAGQKGEPIKVAGNFNTWDPGNDDTYEAKKDPETQQLSVTIPVNKGRKAEDIEFKLLRGKELKSEVDEFGEIIVKRNVRLSKDGKVYVRVENWEDSKASRKNYVTIVLTEVPENTPENDYIHLVGNFNNWYPGDNSYIFNTKADGTYFINIPRQDYGLSFKVTRGSWDTEAADRYGRKLNNFEYNYNEIDTVYISIANWLDRSVHYENKLTIILEEIPKTTPKGNDIFLASNLNGWQPGDWDQKFELNTDGIYSISLSTEEARISFKITRGEWPTEAADLWGDKLNNYDFELTGNDTLRLKIENWVDLD